MTTENKEASKKTLRTLSEGKKYRHASELTKEEFATACVLWESGDYHIDVIAEELLVYKKTLEARFNQAGLKRSKSEPFKPNGDDKQKAKEIMSFDGFDVAVKIGDTRKRTYNLYHAAEAQAASLITQAAKEGVSVAKYKEDFKAIKEFVSIVQIASEGKMKMLGATAGFNFEDDATLPVLTIDKLTDEDIEKLGSDNYLPGSDDADNIVDIIEENGIVVEENE